VFTGQFDDGEGTCKVLVIWMPGPGSYTREDVVEFHLPGNPHLLQAALDRLLKLGAQIAQPGEFTRRAFENGALDLTRAEGVLALIESANEDQRRSATALLLGGLGTRIAGLRDRLDDLRALLEASLDFDETDTGHVPAEELEVLFQAALDRLGEASQWESARETGADLPRIVLAGAPNAGKSSLYNALTEEGQEVQESQTSRLSALVDSLAGSTRDVRRGEISLGTGRATLIDAAGVLDLGEGVGSQFSDLDRRAADRARQEIQAAHLVLWVLDGGAEPPLGLDPPGLVVWNQIDRDGVPPLPTPISGALGYCAVSARDRLGLDELRQALAKLLGFDPGSPGPSGGTGAGEPLGRQLRARHLGALRTARTALEQAHRMQTEGAPLDLVAEALRAVTWELNLIEGSSTPEDLLDRIFSRFCLGK
jgi:tRNA modification GTPase